MGYSVIVEHAKEHLSGQGLQSKIRSTFREKTDEEKAVARAEKTDEQLRKDAVQMLRIVGLPADRLPSLENLYFSVRHVAREQLAWCRHVELLQDLRHTRHPSTHYRSVPNYICACQLLGYRSAVPSSDWAAV